MIIVDMDFGMWSKTGVCKVEFVQGKYSGALENGGD